jgi:outer membrane protein assembly factor BamB
MVIFTKPRPAGMDDWSHLRHGADGNAVSKDLTLGVPNHLQWVAGPTRSYHRLNFGPIAARPGRLLSAGGRNFYQQGGNVVARSAFNGVLLWVKPISTSTSKMVASEKYFYSCPKNDITAYDTLTGEKAFTCSEQVKCSMLMLVDGLVISVGTDGIKAFDAKTGKKKWTCAQPVKGAIADQGRVFFGSSTKLTCISLKDGKQLWSKDVSADVGPKSGLQFAFNGMLCFVGSADKVKEAVILKGKNGSLAWKARNNHEKGMVFFAGGLLWIEHTQQVGGTRSFHRQS